VDLTYAPLQASLVTASGLLAAAIGLFALLRRGHWVVTLLFSSAFLSVAAFQAGTLGMLQTDSAFVARTWATYLAGVSALASWLWLSLSVVLTRPEPWKEIRDAGAYLTLALVGCVLMWAMAGTPWVVRDVVGGRGVAVITLGPMGKVYLLYLVVVMVAVLMNFERLLRVAPAQVRHWLRPLFYAFLAGVLTELLVVSGGLLFGGLRVAWLAASAPPLFAAGTVTALALARRRLSDMSVPVARPVIYYSSVSLIMAGAFLLGMAVLSTVVPVLSPALRRVVSLVLLLLAGGGGLLLTLSPRASRAVKQFVDRNFYANRYDYRREWERVSAGIVPTARLEDVCRQSETLVCGIFGAARAAFYLRDDRLAGRPAAAVSFRLLHGPAAMPPVIDSGNALVRELERTRVPVLFREAPLDPALAAVAEESRAALEALRAAACAPLQAGEDVVGLLWLSEKRNGEEYSFEDAEFLGAMARQLGAALWFARLAEQLAETRQLESLHRLSSYVLHDIKNHVSGLSLLVQNARQHMANPDFQRDALKTLEQMVAGLTALTNQVAGVARPTALEVRSCGLKDLLEEAAMAVGLAGAGAGRDGVRFQLTCHGPDTVTLDRRLVLRVLVNLLTNAREALAGPGTIELAAGPEPGPGETPGLVFRVRDTGRGMSEEFMRTSLFRPFTTTKPAGLGVGLSQCRRIVEALGGAITVESQPGSGTTFSVRLPAAAAEVTGKTA
jgi:hypothetical protein